MKGTIVITSMLVLLACEKEAEPPSDRVGKEKEAEVELPPKEEPASPREATPAPTKTEQPEASKSGDRAGAKAILEALLKPETDTAALSATLVPTETDFKKAFADDVAEAMAKAYAPMFETMALDIKPNEGQTELLLRSATSEQLRTGGGEAREFPGGYKQVAEKLHDGVTWYRFKFVRPGEEIGMAYDGLTFIDGRWVIFPKPWRAYSQIAEAAR